MKKIFYCFIVSLTALLLNNKAIAQSANKTLSNLNSPIKINVNLLPDKAGSRSVGSANKSWKNIYLDTAVYLRGIRFLASPTGFFPGSIGNTAVGLDAMHSNGSGEYNIAVGDSAFYSNLYGSNNVSIGYFSLYKNMSGSANTAVGSDALYTNTGDANTASGAFSLFNNTAGNGNTATGVYALNSNTTASYNTANGYSALDDNETGNYNSAFGTASLNVNSTGDYNTAGGYTALYYNRGSYNTGFGSNTLYLTTTSLYNTAVGYNAGSSYDNGYNNVFVGANTDVNGQGYYNVIAIGQGTVCTASSQVTMGNGATDSYRAYANWTNISDERVKRNIKQNVPGLAFINKLRAITYNLDLNAVDNIIQAQRKDSTGKIIPLSNIEITARKAKEQIVYTGFIAQDVEKSAKELNYDFSGVDAAKNDKDLYGLRYAEFVVPLVKAVQELSVQNDSLKNENKSLEARVAKLEIMMNAQSSIINSKQTVNISSASLSQNTPNPFQNSTTITYNLPQKYSSAKIIITDKIGKVLKEINVSGNEEGSVNVDASMLSGGAYQYSLYVDGKLINTKQMMLSK